MERLDGAVTVWYNLSLIAQHESLGFTLLGALALALTLTFIGATLGKDR